MASASHSQAVKCLNKSPGGRRFVFKSFSQRVREIDIDVYRSLDPVPSEPSKASSFFLDALLHWRELNTAEDFISFYEEMMPIVQTLPQILLHKDAIFTQLLNRIQFKSRLSLEPILGLVAALTRDILEESIPFLSTLVDTILVLLRNGGEHDPEVLEQVFTSWSYIMMYLRKYLIGDVVKVLKDTTKLRYYPKDYVQEFMAESMSFLMRNAPVNQLEKGIIKVLTEASRQSSARKAGAVALLWHIMRGTSSALHSRAEHVMGLLFSRSILGTEGSETILPVICGALQRLCMELGHGGLNVVWNCLLEMIRSSCCLHGCLIHMDHLLSILISVVQYSNTSRNLDYKSVLELVNLLVEKYIVSFATIESEEHSTALVNKSLQLMLCLLDMPSIFNNSSIMSSILLQWAPVFTLGSSSLITFIKELILKDTQTIYFLSYILSTMDRFIDAAPEDVLSVLVTLYNREVMMQSANALDKIADVNVSRICSFFDRTLCYWNQLIKNIITEQGKSDREICNSELTVMWGIFRCYSSIQSKKEESLVLVDIVDSLSQLLVIETEIIVGLPRSTWQSMLGAALASYHKILLGSEALFSELSKFLQIAKVNKSSAQVLFSVAEFMDSTLGSANEAVATRRLPELDVDQAINAASIFSHNMALSSKLVRVSTLRILSHFAPLDCRLLTEDGRPNKKLKREGSACNDDSQSINVIQLLLTIESSPLTLNSREKTNMISSIRTGLNVAKVHDAYLPLLTNALIGIFHIRFRPLWESTMQCLIELIRDSKKVIWDCFFRCLVNCQSHFLEPNNHREMPTSECCNPNALGDCFNLYLASDPERTPCVTVLGLLLESLKKEPNVAESHSDQLIQLFLRFLGYPDDSSVSVHSFSSHSCRTKEWNVVLTEWLDLLRSMRNSLSRNNFLKDVLSNRLLDEMDPNVQLKVLDCLLNWKDDFLLPYEQHLKNLTNLENLREELATWSLSKESCCIKEEHRANLIPLVIRILVPKVKNVKMLASQKHVGVNRKALLCYLAQLDVDELSLFFSLTFHPIFSTNPSFENSDYSFRRLHSGSKSSILRECSTTLKVDNLPWKKRSGFLHVIEDVLKTFDGLHLKPFLSALLIVVVCILESCFSGLQSTQSSESFMNTAHETQCCTPSTVSSFHEMPSIKQMKDLRALCFKIISYVLDKYQDHDFGTEFWKTFFSSIKPLIERLKQEGASSEKPSSLLSCFVSMSRSPELVSLLDREDILPTIFSILTVKTSSHAVISSVLIFIDNLLNLVKDSDSKEDNLVERLLVPHFDALLLSFHGLSKCCKKPHRNLMSGPGKMEIRILKRLASYVHEVSAARLFVDIMLPLFRKKSLSSDECLEGLHVIKRIVRVMDILSTEEFLNAIHSLLVSAELSIRLCICDILDNLAAIHPSVGLLAGLLHELNATSSSELDELDYDTRIRAYNKIKPDLFYKLQYNQALILMSHCVYDISSEDLIVRQSASNSLISFIQFSAALLDYKSEICTETASDDLNTTTGTWTKSSIQRVINTIFLQNMGEAMCKGAAIQKEWMVLLQEMVLKLPGVFELHLLRPLCSEDPEVDFFNNILHLQIHKRTMALSRFRNAIIAGSFSEALLVKIFIPLFITMMFDVKDGKGEHLRNAFLDSLACISGQMHWKAYHRLLLRCFRETVLKPDKQKFLLRLICSILDMFHFYANEPNCAQHDIVCECKDSHTCKTMTSKLPFVHTEIQESLQKTILPKIGKLLNSETESLNVNASLVALKLLKLLKRDTMELHLPSIIHRISNFLKSRLESVRDEARTALVMCLKELGLACLQDIIKVLLATLKRGFELHVLGYTLNFILSKCLVCPSLGSLDYCLEKIISVILNDILGDVAAEKEVDKIAFKMKETRKRMSFETIKLVAQNISFNTHAMTLLTHVKIHLQKHVTAKAKVKLGSILHNIASGIKCNPSADQKEVLVFVYGLISDDVIIENLKRKKMSACETDKKLIHEMADGGNALESVGLGLQSSHLITVFALEVLNNCLKSMKLDKEDTQLLSMLDPFIKLLKVCLSSKYEDVLSATFKCLSVLIRLPLPTIDLYADEIKLLLLDIAQNTQNTNSMLIQSCLKLLTVLLTKISLSNDQLHMIIQFPLFIDLQTNPSPVALSLLKQIVSRKLAVPELYDVVSKVAELMVSSQSDPIRKKCSHILLKFLLDYPLSENHRQQRLNFFLTNLSYVHASGREAVLEMLHAILVKFPKREVDVHAQTIFLHLVVCLANERETKVASMVSMVIKLLISRTSQSALHQILEYTLSWYKGGKHHLWGAAAQVLALLVEAFKDKLQNKVYDLLQIAKSVLDACLCASLNNELESLNTESPFHKGAFYSLAMLEKLLLEFPDLYSDHNVEGLWDNTCKFLQHPHIQLQNISSQLVAIYFQKATETGRTSHDRLHLENLLLMNPCRLFKIAVSYCIQLKSVEIDPASSNLITQNLTYTICGLHSFVRNKRGTPLCEYWSALDSRERSCYLEAFELLGSRKVMNSFLLLSTDETSVILDGKFSTQPDHTDDLQSLLVVSLLKKIGKMAISQEDNQMKVVFNCYRIIMSQIGSEGCRDYAIHILEPLYKVCEGFSGKVISDEAKHFAEVARDSIWKLLGNEYFIDVYNLIRKKLKEKRDKRRQEERIMQAIDPERDAKRKLRISAKHRAHKKRKIMGLKMLRWRR